MTTRAQLESEREALAYVADLVPADCESAVRASRRAMDALLSLSDEHATCVATLLENDALEYDENAAEDDAPSVPGSDAHTLMRPSEAARMHRTVANLIRREPRGDV